MRLKPMARRGHSRSLPKKSGSKRVARDATSLLVGFRDSDRRPCGLARLKALDDSRVGIVGAIRCPLLASDILAWTVHKECRDVVKPCDVDEFFAA